MMEKVILVDAWNTFITEDGIDKDIKKLLDTFHNKKIIVTNANMEEQVKLGFVNLPYDMFTLSHQPNKNDPKYYINFLKKYDLLSEQCIYFEHNEEAVQSAISVGIHTYHFDYKERDINALQSFLLGNI